MGERDPGGGRDVGEDDGWIGLVEVGAAPSVAATSATIANRDVSRGAVAMEFATSTDVGSDR